MKREEVIEFLKSNQDEFLCGNQSEGQWVKTGEIFNQLRGMKLDGEMVKLIFLAIKEESDPYWLQSLPALLGEEVRGDVVASINDLIVSDSYWTASHGVLMIDDFLSADYLDNLIKFISRDDGEIDGIETAIEVIQEIGTEFSIEITEERIGKALPDWFHLSQKNQNEKEEEFRLEITLEDASVAMMEKDYEKVVRLLEPFESALGTSGINRLKLARKKRS